MVSLYSTFLKLIRMIHMEVQLVLIVKKKAERTLKLLEEGTIRKEERNRARRFSSEIQGFGNGRQFQNQTL